MQRLPGILALGNMIFGGSRRCRHGSFPGSLFLLPALMFGGWIAAAAAGGILSLVCAVAGGAFSGLESVASGVFSGSGIIPGIVIGLAAFCFFRNRDAQNAAEGEEE